MSMFDFATDIYLATSSDSDVTTNDDTSEKSKKKHYREGGSGFSIDSEKLDKQLQAYLKKIKEDSAAEEDKKYNGRKDCLRNYETIQIS